MLTYILCFHAQSNQCTLYSLHFFSHLAIYARTKNARYSRMRVKNAHTHDKHLYIYSAHKLSLFLYESVKCT